MAGKKSYKIVYVPAETSEPLKEWKITSSEEKLVESLLDKLKAHYTATGPQKTAAQLRNQQEELMKSLPAGTNVDEGVLRVATSMQMVENIALLANAPDNGFIGVNMYVDDEGAIKDLPHNVRASEIAMCAGKPMQVRGDAFLARVFDNGDDFDRLDFTVSEVSSSASWVRSAAEQNRRKQQDPGVQEFAQRLQQRNADALASGADAQPAAAAKGSELRVVASSPASPAEAAKAAGNKAFAAGNFKEAVRHYSEALQADSSLAAAQNNRALAYLKLQRHSEAEADATAVLQQQPANVKALLRRGNAREALEQRNGALADYQEALRLEPKNKEAQDRVRTLTDQGL